MHHFEKRNKILVNLHKENKTIHILGDQNTNPLNFVTHSSTEIFQLNFPQVGTGGQIHEVPKMGVSYVTCTEIRNRNPIIQYFFKIFIEANKITTWL